MSKFSVPNQAVIHRWVVKLIVFILARKLGIDDYVIGGSYRRGKWFCNDIDLIVPVKSEMQKKGLLIRMKQLGWFDLNRGRDKSEIMWAEQFVKKIGNHRVVLDLFLIDPGSMGNALVFTTGPASFNDKIRKQIVKHGYSWYDPRYFIDLQDNSKIVFDTEIGVFNFLGLRWLKPKHRK